MRKTAWFESVAGRASNAFRLGFRVLELDEKYGSAEDIAWSRNIIGSAFDETGDYPSALEHYWRSVEIAKEFGLRQVEAAVLANIGLVHYHTGDYPRALENMLRALELNEGAQNFDLLTHNLNGLTGVYVNMDDFATAKAYSERALEIATQHGLHEQAANALHALGLNAEHEGDYISALTYFQKALERIQLHGLADDIRYRITIGEVLVKLLRLDEARSVLASITEIAMENPYVRWGRHNLTGAILQAEGDLEGAYTSFQAGLEECEAHGLRMGVSGFHKDLRDLALKRNDLARYVLHNDAYQKINEEIRGRDTATQLAMLAKQREIDEMSRERERERAVLYSTLPKHIADRVIKGETVNDHIDNAAVMFLDIVGFTTLSNSLTSQQVVALLDEVFKICDDACNANNVTRIKTIGDSYMAVAMPNAEFLIPNLNVAIANAALQIIERVKGFDSQSLQVRIGLHVGPVTAGILGKERLQYDVWGDTVNVASRMEGTSEPNRVQVSDTFAATLRATSQEGISKETNESDSDLARGTWHLALRGEVEIKGLGTMSTYWLTNSH